MCHERQISLCSVHPELIKIDRNTREIQFKDADYFALYQPNQNAKLDHLDDYLPPELRNHDFLDYDAYSLDVYCLGVLPFELLFGITPDFENFNGDWNLFW